MCLKRSLKHSDFLMSVLSFWLLTDVVPLPQVTANSNHPHSATTAFIPIPMALPWQTSPLLWYYGSNRDTTIIPIPCQLLSLTAKTSWTYTPWLSTSTVYCIACWQSGTMVNGSLETSLRCSMMKKWHSRISVDLLQHFVGHTKKTFVGPDRKRHLLSIFAPLLVETTPSVVTLNHWW